RAHGCRSTTPSSASRPRCRRRSAASTPTSSRRPAPTASRSGPRAPTTGGRSSSRTASRPCAGCSSSTPSTRETSAGGSRGSTSPTARRSRACRRSSARSPTCARAGWAAAARLFAVAGQYVAYTFFRLDPAWRRLPIDERAAGKDAFAEVVDEFAGRMEGLRAYTTTGVRPEADFFLWQITERYDDLLELGAALNGTPLAGWLSTPHSYLATTKPSVYTDKKRVRQGKVIPRDAPYLVVYPFVKVRPWYFLTFEELADAMREHAEVGGKFVT